MDTRAPAAESIAPPHGSVVVKGTGSSGHQESGSSAVYDKQLAWKLNGERKLTLATKAVRMRERDECTFSPKTNRRSGRKVPIRSPRSAPASPGADSHHDISSVFPTSPTGSSGSSLAPTAVRHSEAQESSILLHLARQDRARTQVIAAQQRMLSEQPPKDFSKTTTSVPFALSTSNWRPHKSTPTDGAAEPSSDSTSASNTANMPRRPSFTSRSKTHSSPPLTSATADAWETERATLVAILDAQRRELELREKAQQDAVRVAESFAAATQSFEERLVALEQSTALELAEIRRLLARQTAATDLVLHSLGIASPRPPSDPVPSNPSGKG